MLIQPFAALVLVFYHKLHNCSLGMSLSNLFMSNATS